MPGAWESIKELHRTTTLGAKEGVAFRYFSRPLASFILYFIRNSRITPNQVTIASLLVGIVGALVHISFLSYWGLVVGGALFMLAHVLDALDGQLARLRKAGSTVGMHFDFFIDELKAYLMFGALALRLWMQHADGDFGFTLLWPLIALFGPECILILGLIGLGGLAVGISCTQFLKLECWKETFPDVEADDVSDAAEEEPAAPSTHEDVSQPESSPVESTKPEAGEEAPDAPDVRAAPGEETLKLAPPPEKPAARADPEPDSEATPKKEQQSQPAADARTGFAKFVEVAEKAGRFVIDYPSYIIVLCLLNRVDLYLILYSAAVILYAGRTLFGVSLKLWRVDPYRKTEEAPSEDVDPGAPATVEADPVEAEPKDSDQERGS